MSRSGARSVVVTGAAGRIGRVVCPILARRWDLRRADLRWGPGEADPGRPAAGKGALELDIGDLDACRASFAGAEAVVHLAAVPSPTATWEQLLPANVVGVRNVAQAAMDQGVDRLVLASSIQAVSAYPPGTQVRADDQARPANLYGATKAWAEAVGSWVAAVSRTSVVVLRIGYFSEEPPRDGGSHRGVLDRAAWLSHADAAELVRAAVEAPGVEYLVANGVSANRYRLAELAQSATMGYHPRDDAWDEGRAAGRSET